MCIECGSVRVERSESAEEIAYADGYDERNQKFGAIECERGNQKHIFPRAASEGNERKNNNKKNENNGLTK